MSNQSKITLNKLAKRKGKGPKITVLTAYDCPMARFISKAGIDIILVSDAVGTVGMGRPEAVSVTVDEMIYHTKACRNGAGNSMVVTTLPFGSYVDVSDAVKNAARIMKEGGADAVHLEGTADDAHIVRAIVGAGIPVVGHVGVIKQKIIREGTIRVQGRTSESAERVIQDVMAMVDAGVCSIVLECIPHALADVITKSVDVLTIGIGAGNGCDGQALVTQDMLGLYKEMAPRFLKIYADLEKTTVDALASFKREVQNSVFPGQEYTYTMPDDELTKLLASLSR